MSTATKEIVGRVTSAIIALALIAAAVYLAATDSAHSEVFIALLGAGGLGTAILPGVRGGK